MTTNAARSPARGSGALRRLARAPSFWLGGAFIIEVVFAFPGVGELAIKAIQFRDFPLIQGVTLVVAVTTVALNLVVDVLYGVVNPQVQFR